MKYPKLIVDSRVAVLYSADYGSGWSTWNPGKEWMIFHKDLATAVIDNKQQTEIMNLASELNTFYHGTNSYICLHGCAYLKIQWVLIGSIFQIDVFDGKETVIVSNGDYHVA